MKSSLKSPLTQIVHVDKFMERSGREEDKRDRSKGLEKLIVLAGRDFGSCKKIGQGREAHSALTMLGVGSMFFA